MYEKNEKMLHTLGLKTQREFFDYDGKPYELVGMSHSNGSELVIVRCLVGEDSLNIVPDEVFNNDFKKISQGDVFTYIDNDNDAEHAEMMNTLGVGYICPFCGGRLAWESDFMASEMRGMLGGYIEVTDEQRIADIRSHENEYRRCGLLGDTEDITPITNECENTGYYQYTYMKETKRKNGVEIVRYYEANDSVIGIYTCMNCGKNYEIMDCMPSEEHNYPFFD